MTYLLDTPAVFALACDPEAVPWRTREVLAEPGSAVSVSVVAVWEASELAASGKLKLDRSVEAWFRDFVAEYSCPALDFTLAHAVHLAKLPPGGDVFHRLIAAQALVEGATVVTPDEALAAFPVRVLW